MIRIAVAFSLSLLLFSCGAMIRGSQGADLGDWFKSLRQPTTGMSCCDLSDCRRLTRDDVEIRDGDYWVFNHGRWMKVDEDKILHRENLAEAPVLCSSPNTLFCFIAWDELS